MHQHYLVPPVAGPMARSLSSIEHFMQSLLDSNPWNIDPGCIPIPWRKELAAKPTGKLRLGIVYDDGVVKPQPPIARAMREVAEKLKEAGHEGVYTFQNPLSLSSSSTNQTSLRMGHLPPRHRPKPVDKSHPRRWRPTLSLPMRHSRGAINRRDGCRDRER